MINFLDLDILLSRIHTKIHKHGINGLRKFATLMQEADADPEREIDLLEELPDLFADAGIYLNLQEHTELANYLDKTGEGKATLEQIINVIAPSLHPDRLKAVNEAFDFFSGGAESCPPDKIGNFRYPRERPATFAIPKTPTTRLLNQMIIIFGKSVDDVTREDFENYFRESSYLFNDNEQFIKCLKTNIKEHPRIIRRKNPRTLPFGYSQ